MSPLPPFPHSKKSRQSQAYYITVIISEVLYNFYAIFQNFLLKELFIINIIINVQRKIISFSLSLRFYEREYE